MPSTGQLGAGSGIGFLIRLSRVRIPPGPLFLLWDVSEGVVVFRHSMSDVSVDAYSKDPPHLDDRGGRVSVTMGVRSSSTYRLSSEGFATTSDAGLELSTRLHRTHVIVPLPRGLPDDEPSRQRGE